MSFDCSLKMAPEESRNVRNKLITITLAVMFMIKILVFFQLYRLPKPNKILKRQFLPHYLVPQSLQMVLHRQEVEKSIQILGISTLKSRLRRSSNMFAHHVTHKQPVVTSQNWRRKK